MIFYILPLLLLLAIPLKSMEVASLKHYAAKRVHTSLQQPFTVNTLEKLLTLPADPKTFLIPYLLENKRAAELYHDIHGPRAYLRCVDQFAPTDLEHSTEGMTFLTKEDFDLLGGTYALSVSNTGRYALIRKSTQSETMINLIDISQKKLCYYEAFQHEEQHFRTLVNTVYSSCLSPQDQYFAVGVGRYVYLYDTKTCKKIHTTRCYKNVSSLLFSHDEKILFIGSEDTFIRKVNLETKTVELLAGHKFGVTNLAQHPDGKRLASLAKWFTSFSSGASSCAVHIWDLSTNTCVKTVRLRATDLAFSSCGKYLFFMDRGHPKCDSITVYDWYNFTEKTFTLFKGRHIPVGNTARFIIKTERTQPKIDKYRLVLYDMVANHTSHSHNRIYDLVFGKYYNADYETQMAISSQGNFIFLVTQEGHCFLLKIIEKETTKDHDLFLTRLYFEQGTEMHKTRTKDIFLKDQLLAASDSSQKALIETCLHYLSLEDAAFSSPLNQKPDSTAKDTPQHLHTTSQESLANLIAFPELSEFLTRAEFAQADI